VPLVSRPLRRYAAIAAGVEDFFATVAARIRRRKQLTDVTSMPPDDADVDAVGTNQWGAVVETSTRYMT